MKNKVFLTNSVFSSRIIKEVYSLSPTVLYPPVNVKDFHPSSKKEDLVVSVGRFDSFKKFECLIRAFADVKNGKCAIIGNIYNSASIKYLRRLNQLINNLKLNNRVNLMINCSFEKVEKVRPIIAGRANIVAVITIEALVCG